MNHFESFDAKPKAEVAAIDAESATGHAEHEPDGASDNHDCCGCSTMALLDVAPPVDILRRASLVTVAVSALHRRGPTLDSPYPIATI